MTRPAIPTADRMTRRRPAKTIELLYFAGCPHHDALLGHVHELLRRHALSAHIVPRHIDDDGAAQRERFLGSPTLRVDGRDVEPGAHEREDFGLKCRLYRSRCGVGGVPPEEWTRSALERARAAE